MKKGPELLESYEDNWETDIGAWFPGERVVYQGKDLLRECSGYSWFKLLSLGILGRELTDQEVKLYESVWVLATSFPEPRLWNNRVAALAGTSQSTAALGIAAATAASEALTYGRRADIRACTFLHKLYETVQSGGSLSEFVEQELQTHRCIPGFGRPVTSADERIAPLLEKASNLGFSNGRYLSLVYEVQDYLDKSRKRLKMNVAIIIAALFSDIGFSPREYYCCAVLSFSAGMFPCYRDSSTKPEGSFFPLATDRLRYTGVLERSWG